VTAQHIKAYCGGSFAYEDEQTKGRGQPELVAVTNLNFVTNNKKALA